MNNIISGRDVLQRFYDIASEIAIHWSRERSFRDVVENVYGRVEIYVWNYCFRVREWKQKVYRFICISLDNITTHYRLNS
jgi:hypothetical protein